MFLYNLGSYHLAYLVVLWSIFVITESQLTISPLDDSVSLIVYKKNMFNHKTNSFFQSFEVRLYSQ